jgi:hypothetical protein
MRQVDLDTATKELHGRGASTKSDGNWTFGDFYIEVDVHGVLERDVETSKDPLTRLRVVDGPREAILVVWGSGSNRKNLDLVSKQTPGRIRVESPVRPDDRYIGQGVDLWAHERITRIEALP